MENSKVQKNTSTHAHMQAIEEETAPVRNKTQMKIIQTPLTSHRIGKN